MELCLVRHGIAVERGSAGYTNDASRPLTEEGRERMGQVAAGLARLWMPELVVSSPLVRARETAEILQVAWGEPRMRFSEALATGDHDELFDDIRDMGGERVAVVGHEPWLSGLLSLVLSGDAAQVRSQFKKGGAALVLFAEDTPGPGDGQLAWFLPPRVVRETA